MVVVGLLIKKTPHTTRRGRAKLARGLQHGRDQIVILYKYIESRRVSVGRRDAVARVDPLAQLKVTNPF